MNTQFDSSIYSCAESLEALRLMIDSIQHSLDCLNTEIDIALRFIADCEDTVEMPSYSLMIEYSNARMSLSALMASKAIALNGLETMGFSLKFFEAKQKLLISKRESLIADVEGNRSRSNDMAAIGEIFKREMDVANDERLESKSKQAELHRKYELEVAKKNELSGIGTLIFPL